MTIEIPTGFYNLIHVFGVTGTSKNYTTALGITNTEDLDIVEASVTAADAWVATMRDETYSNCYLHSVVAVTDEASAEATRNAFGLKSGDVGDVWDTAILKKTTALKGQGHRGRMFLPGLLADDEIGNSGGIDPIRQGELLTVAAAWLTELSTTIGAPVLLHTVGSPSGPDPDPIINLSISPNIGVQRRRRTLV